MRNILNWLNSEDRDNENEQMTFAMKAQRSITEVAQTIGSERRRLGSLIHRELLVKEALTELNTSNAPHLASKRTSYETALTRLRKRINEIRHRWARMQKEITTLAQDARKRLPHSGAELTHEVQEEITTLLSRLNRMRAAIARKMTLSARLYDGAAMLA